MVLICATIHWNDTCELDVKGKDMFDGFVLISTIEPTHNTDSSFCAAYKTAIIYS